MPAAPAVVKIEGVHKGPCRNDGQTVSDIVPAREDTPPELVTDAQPRIEQSGSNEDVDDDPDLSMRAGLIVNGVSLQREIAALNDDVPS